MKNLILTALIAALPVFTWAKTTPKRVIEMPVENLVAIVDSNDTISFATTNGRYVIQGQIYDTWLGSYLDTGDALKESAHLIPLSRIGINPDDLGALTIGKSGKPITVFTDPYCAPCAKAIDEMSKIAEQGEYQFKILVVPALGGESLRAANAIGCTNDRPEALRAILNHTPDAVSGDKSCRSETYLKMLTTATTLGVKEVPFFIHADGRVMRGKPKNIADWLKGAK